MSRELWSCDCFKFYSISESTQSSNQIVRRRPGLWPIDKIHTVHSVTGTSSYITVLTEHRISKLLLVFVSNFIK